MSALPFALRLICCCSCWLILFSTCLVVATLRASSRVDRTRRSLPGDDEDHLPASSRPSIEVDAYDELSEDDLIEDYAELNVTAEKSKYLGSPCDGTCNPMLQHVFCDPQTNFCECEEFYPVQLGPTKGCAKPKKLGEQCLYRATCLYLDQHSTCTQVLHNAVCECEAGYHRVALSRPNKKLFCAADLVLIATDLPTLLGVASGIAVLTGLICFVLKLFSRARYTRPRHYANAGQAPPMLFSSDTGIPVALHGGRPPSRSSQRSSGGTINCVLGRKQSTCGPLVPASRAGAARAAAILLISCHRQPATSATSAGNGGKHRRALSDVAEGSSDGLGSRRPSLASIHSSTSSAKSYSARRLERERNEKEQRHALVELKLKHREQQQQHHYHQHQHHHHHQQQQQQQHHQQQQQQQPVPAPTPSPRTPHSTDELLPSVEEATEIFYNEQIPTTSGTASNATSDQKVKTATTTSVAKSNEPTSPLFENDAKPCSSSNIYRP